MLTGPLAASDLRVHLSTVLIGLHWLYDTPQPRDAVLLDGHRQSLASAGGWQFTFIPTNDSGSPTIVVDSRASRHLLSQNDIDELAEHVDDFGEPVRRAYLSGTRGVLELHRSAHPSLLSAMARTRSDQRCPVPTTRQSAAVELADLHQQSLTSSPALHPLAELGSLWPDPFGGPPRGLAPQRNASAPMRARPSKAPPSLRMRCRDERPTN